MSTSLAYYEELRTEAEFCKKLPHLLSMDFLRAARQRGEIAYYAGKRGKVLYHPDDIAQLLKRKEQLCQTGSGNTVTTGLPASPVRRSSMPIGATGADAERVAEVLGRKYSEKPKKS